MRGENCLNCVFQSACPREERRGEERRGGEGRGKERRGEKGRGEERRGEGGRGVDGEGRGVSAKVSAKVPAKVCPRAFLGALKWASFGAQGRGQDRSYC